MAIVDLLRLLDWLRSETEKQRQERDSEKDGDDAKDGEDSDEAEEAEDDKAEDDADENAPCTPSRDLEGSMRPWSSC